MASSNSVVLSGNNMENELMQFLEKDAESWTQTRK